MIETRLTVSILPKTWIVDVDGVLLKHNGYLDGTEQLLPGAREFWKNVGEHDLVIIISARSDSLRESTIKLLTEQGMRVDHALFGLPVGERIVVNDNKPSGLQMGHAINLVRDSGLAGMVVIQDADL
jgi:hypothetical protein